MTEAFRITQPVRLPWGYASVCIAGGKVRSIAWERTKEDLRARLREEAPGAAVLPADSNDPGLILLEYARRKHVLPSVLLSVPFDWDRVTDFTRVVLDATLRIPFAAVATYRDIAHRTGNPLAARAVGGALARNPWPVLIPCHRVIGSTGALVGFGKGEEAKRALLEFERGAIRADA